MKTKPSLVEAVLRLFFALNFMFSPIAPGVTGLLASQSKPIESPELTEDLVLPQRVLPAQNTEYYTPPFPEPDINDRRTSPDPDEQDKNIPPEKPKEDIEFSLSTSTGELTTGDTVTLVVRVKNNQDVTLNNLVFTDELEDGLLFVDSKDPIESIDSDTNTVSFLIDSLSPGQEVEIQYQIKTVGSLSIAELNKAWIHIGELQVGNSSLKAKTMFQIVKEKDCRNGRHSPSGPYQSSYVGTCDRTYPADSPPKTCRSSN